MKPLTLGEIAMVTGGRVVQGDPGRVFSSVSTDTRTINKQDLFLALSGDRYDAHDFLAEAVAAGAGGLVVSRLSGIPEITPAVFVDNTLKALQDLAAVNLAGCGSPPVIGITGSTGKTTTKDMTAAVLGTRLKTLKTSGNLNNEIGLPLTLLSLEEQHQVVVAEMAMRGPGQIDELCRIARPFGAVITNINETHMEILGSVDKIAAAKGEILDCIPPEGFAILNRESPYIDREARRCRGKVLFFAIDQPADIKAEDIRLESGGSWFYAVTREGRHEFYIPVPGRHNVMNALAAIGVGWELGLEAKDMARGLAVMKLTGMRLEIVETDTVTIINDSYNASPASMKAALGVLRELGGGRRTVAVLGNMLELGQRSVAGHREAGAVAAGTGLDLLVTVGDLAAGIATGAVAAGLPEERILRCGDNLEAAVVLDKMITDGDVLLVKGSRGMKMEQLVAHLLESGLRRDKGG